MKQEHTSVRTLAVGVVVPVHNEQELLGSALASLTDAFDELSHGSLLLRAAVVMDACADVSEEIASEWRVALVRRCHPLAVTMTTSTAHNVGRARALGCAVLLNRWSRIDPARIWLATTDADSRVPRDWLTTQLAQHEMGVDHWYGRVSVALSTPTMFDQAGNASTKMKADRFTERTWDSTLPPTSRLVDSSL